MALELNRIRKALSSIFQGVIKNLVSLGDDSTLESDFKPLKVGDKNTPIEISETDVKINGSQVITEKSDIDSLNDLSDVTYSSGDLTITSLDKIVAGGDLTLDCVGDITLDAAGGQVSIKDASASHFLFDCDNTQFIMYDDTDEADLFKIVVAASGATTLRTVDDGATIGHLIFQPDGDLILDPVSGKTIIDATDGLYFDGGGDTYMYEQSADALRIVVGGDVMMHMAESGDDGSTISFPNSSVGFTRVEATFRATGIIGSGGTDDTDIDFRFCNKFRLEMTGDITTINLIFPSVSGNFLLVCTTDGDHDVTNWKVFESDETAATTTDVMWAGGSVPAFTSSGVDIVSFYWDATEQQAYGVASLAFATP